MSFGCPAGAAGLARGRGRSLSTSLDRANPPRLFSWLRAVGAKSSIFATLPVLNHHREVVQRTIAHDSAFLIWGSAKTRSWVEVPGKEDQDALS
jgi:hypothetical protein